MDSHLPKKLFYLLQWKPLKNVKKCFLFYLKSSFLSQDIEIFDLAFLVMWKKRLDHKYDVNFNIYEITTWLTIHILSYISRSKGNQTMKVVQLIENNKRNIFLQKSYAKWGRETSPEFSLFFEKTLYQVKASSLSLILLSFDSRQLSNKNKLYKTLCYWSRNMINFEFLEKSLGMVCSYTFFVYDFSRKMFFMLYSFEILGNMFIAIFCFPGFEWRYKFWN